MKSIKIKRFGKLLPVDQTGNYGNDDFHSAPCQSGFYCFNQKFVELFLSGHKLYNSDVYTADIVGGYIWIHLEPKKRNMIIETHGSWFKVRAEDYHRILKSVYNQEVTYFTPGYGIATYAKDHLEIFCTEETILKNVRKCRNKLKERGQEKSREIENENWEKEYNRFKFNNDLKEEALKNVSQLQHSLAKTTIRSRYESYGFSSQDG